MSVFDICAIVRRIKRYYTLAYPNIAYLVKWPN